MVWHAPSCRETEINKYILSYLASTSEVTEIAHPVRTLLMNVVCQKTFLILQNYFEACFTWQSVAICFFEHDPTICFHVYLMAFFFQGALGLPGPPGIRGKPGPPVSLHINFCSQCITVCCYI